MSFSTGLKKKLTIHQCEVNDGKVEAKKSPKFEAMINPVGYQQISCIQYGKNAAIGVANETKFNKTTPDKYEFKELVLDGTGVVSLVGLETVEDQIRCLREVAYTYDGTTHQTPVVRVLWGPLEFKARLKSLKVDYTLFTPDGKPLRAKVSLSFAEYKTDQQILREARLESPDLTHLIEVKAGDTLPNLCYRIYSDASYCMVVARINRLSNFRCLKPGQVLRFPPLV